MTQVRFSRVLFSSLSGKWRTPLEIFLNLNKEFHFNLDPCKPAIYKSLDLIKKNGLMEDWPMGSRAFLNPKYSQTERWVGKVWVEMCEGRCDLAVFLVPARTDTDWFQFIVKKVKDPIRCINKRVRFGNAKTGAPFPSIIIILRAEHN